MSDQEAHEFYSDPANLRVTGRGRRRKADHLTEMASVRFSARMLARAEAAAHADGLRLSSWIRRLVSFELIRLSRESRERPAGVIPGSARLGQSANLRSSLSLGTLTGDSGRRTFSCPHLSIGNVASASCGICGPLPVAA